MRESSGAIGRTWNAETKSLPSVTEVLRPYQDLRAVPPDALEHAAWRGTEVHRICSCVARGVPYLGGVPEGCAGYVLSFQEWFGFAVISVHLVEQELVDMELGYRGRPDLIARLRGDSEAELTLVDYKTARTVSRIWRGQLAAYRRLADRAGYPVLRTLALRLDETGGPAKVTEYTDHKRDFAAFLAALTAYKYFVQDTKKGGKEP